MVRVVMLTLLVPCTGGVTGVLAAPFVIGAGGVFDAEASVTAMHQVWSQLVGLLVITAWAASVSSLIFFTLNLNNKLRLPREVELAGCDVIKHGEAAYPAEAYTQAEAIITSTIQTETTSYNQVVSDAPQLLLLSSALLSFRAPMWRVPKQQQI